MVRAVTRCLRAQRALAAWACDSLACISRARRSRVASTSSGPGGGTDTAGRLVARYLPKYLPGNPKIVIQNMGGGGGTIGNNYFASEVKPDGLTIGTPIGTMFVDQLIGKPGIEFDGPIVLIQEGGYHPETIGALATSFCTPLDQRRA